MTATAVSPALAMSEEMQKQIIERAAALIARASAPNALLSSTDLASLTGFPYHGSTFKDPSFPRPVMVGSREKRWKSGEVFRWLERRR
jgi:predicted DNA-binding transcriptional regulator AlpA